MHDAPDCTHRTRWKRHFGVFSSSQGRAPASMRGLADRRRERGEWPLAARTASEVCKTPHPASRHGGAMIRASGLVPFPPRHIRVTAGGFNGSLFLASLDEDDNGSSA
ncbi:hypothetical protein MTO96_032412 [Rhipicephalus appendiculatus]